MDQTFKQDFLKGKVVIVTGGATGICYGISQGFLKYGASVIIASRKKDILEKSQQSLIQETGNKNIDIFSLDIRHFDQVEKLADFTIQRFGRIDILVNGAAGNFLVPFEQMSVNAFRSVMEIDTFGTFHCSKAVVSKWMSKNGGIIINISTTLPQCGVALQAHAGTAKAGIDALTRHLAVELGPKNIRVVGLAPGAIGETEGFKRLKMDDTDSIGDYQSLIPLQRVGNNDDIATWALFLASPAASYFTGQTVIVDGGVVNTFPNFTLLSKRVRDMLMPKL